MELNNFRDLEQGLPGDEARPLIINDDIQRNGRTVMEKARPPLQPLLSVTASTLSVATHTSTPSPAVGAPRRRRRSDRRLRRLNTELLDAIVAGDVAEVERLLDRGASPNATCRRDLVSACHMAAMACPQALQVLVDRGAERHRQDRRGRTPLHLAAWMGSGRAVAALLDFPEDLQERVNFESITSEAEEDVRKVCASTRHAVNVPCDLGEVTVTLPNEWKDNIDHECLVIAGSLPLLQPGWSPLHIAAARCRVHCARLLLAAGADPGRRDVQGLTPLDVVGSAHYYDLPVDGGDFVTLIKMLVKAGGKHNTMTLKGVQNINTPLHTAVELESVEAIKELLAVGASVTCLNAAGDTPLHVCVKKELEEPLQILANATTDDDPLGAPVDAADRRGHTPLQAAIQAGWVPGVCVAIEAGADVTMKDHDGETPIHSAAALGNLDVLSEVLSVAQQRSSIDIQNTRGETPLFIAIGAGHLDCVQLILNKGASIKVTLPGDVNALHKAAECGHVDILEVLLDHDADKTSSMINSLCDGGKRGFAPIHFAVFFNHPKCVKLLLERGSDIRSRTTCSPHKESTPLHLCCLKNHKDIAKILLESDKTIIHEVNSIGWFPLHTAAHHVSREIIPLLLHAGADLSGYSDGPKKYRRTAIDMIINNISRPHEYLEDLIDSYITINNRNLQDTDTVLKLDYSVLMPRSCHTEQMKVIEALLKTGNRYNQKRLLVHPLIESFLYLKWKALLPFFYGILICYGCFLFSLTAFIISVFMFKDWNQEAPVWLDRTIWGYILYSTVICILLQELLYMNVKSSRYFLQLETWIKFGSLGMAVILPTSVTISSWSALEWPRHVATIAILFSWIQMMFLLSRFPNWGYYVLMFGKVAGNVIKILATFAFLVIGFSLSFMIQFHSQTPFDGPLSALTKTIVMMTSEFDYQSLFDDEHVADISESVFIVRLFFLVFLIMASIVLMNLLVGVAVNDINDLEVLGNIKRLEKQVEFLGTLDILVYHKVFSCILPRRISDSVRKSRNVQRVIEMYPGRPRWRHMKGIPSRITDAILNKVTHQQKGLDREATFQSINSKIEDMFDVIVNKNVTPQAVDANATENLIVDKGSKFRKKYEEIMKHLSQLDNEMTGVHDKVESSVQQLKAPLDEVDAKLERMSLDISNIKDILNRLDNKHGQ